MRNYNKAVGFLCCILLLMSLSCSQQTDLPETSLQELQLKGPIKTLFLDTIIDDSSLKMLRKRTFNRAGMQVYRYYLNSNHYGDSWGVEFSYTYDTKNQLLFEKGPNYLETFSYNNKGQLIQSIDSDFDGECTTYYKYDGKNRRVKDSTYFSVNTYIFKGDKITRKERYDPRDRQERRDTSTTYYKCDDQNRILEEWEGGENQYDGTLYTYDSLGRETSKIERRGAEIPFGKGRFIYKRTWKYNDHGDVIEICDFRNNSRKADHTWRYRYEYDSLGNWNRKYFIPKSGPEKLLYQRRFTFYDTTTTTKQQTEKRTL